MENKSLKILVTGAAGFIGFHITRCLLKNGHSVIGLDNLSDYYSKKLKEDRLEELGFDSKLILKENICIEAVNNHNLKFYNSDITNEAFISTIFSKYKLDVVIHLAAQAGVRYSLINPETYIKTNINGFFNIIQNTHNKNIKKFIYASSSSVYGDNNTTPFKETDKTNKPESIYAATKSSNELIAHTYSKLYNLNTIGLRFFTVYGPWGRPDMAYYKFADSLVQNKSIDIYNNGNMIRDFTYIDDIIEGITRVIQINNKSPFEVYNIGNDNPINLMDFIKIMENYFKKKFKINFLPHQLGDVKSTHASIENFSNHYNYKPKINLDEGIKNFVTWYKSYNK